jgi:hypothetical protein
VSYSSDTELNEALPRKGIPPMHVIVGNVAALTVALIYYTWRSYFRTQRRQVLCGRVAYMLWVVSQRVEGRRETLAIDQ